jgi:hypothetical protein
MKENVYCVYHFWDMTILEGIAQYNNESFFFESTFESEGGSWMGNTYNLTLLDENIFKLSLENWEYWKQYVEQSVLPPPDEYAEKRKVMTEEEIFSETLKNNLSKLNEKSYQQNELIIKNYLKNTKPIYQAKGDFYGDINGIGTTEVIWENVIKIN